jgi:choline-glycine betaine transporter
MKIIKRFEKLKTGNKIAIYAVILIVLTLGLTAYKQGTFELGLTGSSGKLMPYLHHSRWGAVMALFGAFLVLSKGQKTIGMFLIIIGMYLVVHHLATEQCFALLTMEGNPAGGFC